MVLAPCPQEFYVSKRARELVEYIYREDFYNFAYKEGIIPAKKGIDIQTVLPQAFDWQMYLELHPDLPPFEIYNERTVVRHYLEFGQYEEIPRAFKLDAPLGFDWRTYLAKYPDLVVNGVDNEEKAIKHYLGFGIREGREF